MLTLSLCACGSSPSTVFYTLNSAEHDTTLLKTTSPVYIEMLPVNVPKNLARPQIVLRDGDMRLKIRESDQWGALFNQELRSVLASQIAEKLSATDVTYIGNSPKEDTYRIAVDVQQFDVIKGDAVNSRVSWVVTRLNQSESQSCQFTFTEPVGGTMTEMVGGMQKVTTSIASTIAQAIAMEQQQGIITCDKLIPQN